MIKLSRFSILLLLLALAQSCAAPPFDAKAVVSEWVNYMQSDYQLRPNDRISVSLHPQGLDQEVQIPRSGRVTFKRLNKEMQVIGKSLAGLRAALVQEYSTVFVGGIEVQITLLKSSMDSVYVAGEVKRPGVVDYAPSMTLAQGIAAAGGLAITAKSTDVRVLRNVAGQPPRTFRVNYNDIRLHGAPDFLLLPGDVIFCQTSGIGEAGYLVELWIRRLIPVSFSAASIAPQ
ncbi:MAG: SLBB domain-containing protein [Planctomycetes bacterium]|nr:SLBB domain-containing protein [Planctomycetota bacterium]MCB9869546.1 SLBB domain-containing protein [Planctomycetota bacterium]MCB9889933.1 SLBB domain-containing protein [Planctomycetota bacterium]